LTESFEERHWVDFLVYGPISEDNKDDVCQSYDHLRLQGFRVITEEEKPGNFVTRVLRSKLILDASEFCTTNKIDAFVLMSSDIGFFPLCQRLREKGVRVELASLGPCTPIDLKKVANRFIDLLPWAEFCGTDAKPIEVNPVRETISRPNTKVFEDVLDGRAQTVEVNVPIYSFYRKGEYWVIGAKGEEAHLRGTKGLAIIHYLLRYPNHSLPVLTLYHQGEVQSLNSPEPGDHVPNDANSDNLNFLPKQAYERLSDWRSKIETQIEALKEELEKLSDAGKTVEAMMIRDEIRELKTDLNAKGSIKTNGSDSIRTNVRKHIKTGWNKIHAEVPYLKRYLDEHTLKTGWDCVYRPLIEDPVEWDLYPPDPAS
jgi:uncharacterized LabA/DUF88 family protein